LTILDILRRRIPWISFGMLLLAMTAGAYGLWRYQFNQNMDTAREHADRRLRYLSDLVYNILQKQSYQELGVLIDSAGRHNDDTVHIVLTAANGFVLARYDRPAPAAHTLVLQREVNYSYESRATIEITVDHDWVYANRVTLAWQLGAALFLLGIAFWFPVYIGVLKHEEAGSERARNLALQAAKERLEREIEARSEAEQRLYAEKERAQVTLHSIGDAVITTDADGRVAYMNPVAERDTGWNSDEAAGRPLTEVFNIVSELTGKPAENPVAKCLRDGVVVALANHTALTRRDGSVISIQDSAAPIRERNGRIIGVVMVFHDVSKEREMARDLHHQARHDSLTGLFNRREFEHRLTLLLRSAREDNMSHALLYLDLDQFKVVNDTCGHLAGDELLKQLSKTFRLCLRESDTVARIGGDEFGVLLESCPRDNALRTADVLRETIKGFRFDWQGSRFEVGASIGLAMISAESRGATELLSMADMACYAAKEKGRNRVHQYLEGDAELKKRQGEMQWVSRIGHALENDRLRLHVQPIRLATASGAAPASHYEVLLRMHDEQNRVLLPGEFLPAAERYDMMAAIDRWVIENALRNYRAFAARLAGNGDVLLSINVSGNTLNLGNFHEYIRAKLEQFAVPADRIIFEITETVAISNLVEVSRFMADLRGLGCRFALDDFGSGLSSFSYLKHLPVDYLKIDGSFVVDAAKDPFDRAIIESIHNLGQALGIQTIAEYVESDAIIEVLRHIGVDYVQGFAVGMAEPMV
jgi:diguanylate cyclase (GGDEF)-like protein/PAS domain S-box-containing protein